VNVSRKEKVKEPKTIIKYEYPRFNPRSPMGFCVQDRKSRGLNSTIFLSGIEKKGPRIFYPG
jgi:hypothetical protein